MSTVIKNIEDFETLTESELEELYSWVDTIPLTRPKRNINRDFSDGVLIAEVVKHFLPPIIQLHNFTPANAMKMKMVNWEQLNRKVFKKLNFQLSQESIRAIANGKQFSIECFLMFLRSKIERAVWDLNKESAMRNEKAIDQTKSTVRMHQKGLKMMSNDKPEADQNIISYPPAPNLSPGKANKQQIVSPGRQKVAAPAAGPYRGAKVKGVDEFVPRPIYEEKEQECLAKEETIQILQAKVRRLEHLLHLKDIRIEDLQARLETNRPTGNVRR